MNESERLDFPYMVFARREASAAAFALTFSGMPAADPRVFAGADLTDLGFAGAEALPRLQAELAALAGTSSDRLIVTLGASGAMNAVANALFRPGVRVAVEAPCYEPLRALPKRLGAEVREVERRLGGGWRFDPGEVERALVGARTGHVFLTNPHNPSGTRMPAGDLIALAGIAERAGGILISNEIYMEFAEPGQRDHASELAPNALSIGSLTKAYGLGPLRVGWIALGKGLAALRPQIEDAIFLAWVDPPTPTLRAASAALGRMGELRAPIERMEREAKPMFALWLAGEPSLEASLPDLGVVAFARVRGAVETRNLARRLVADHGVGVVPGEFFGSPGYLRIGFGLPAARLEPALARLSAGLAASRRA